jgi:diadenosine tetraphosphate (Ap4A) HIT family hydrolase
MDKTMNQCPFCTLPEIKERIIIENDLAFAFPTNIPIVPGHVLIVPKRCVQTFYDLTKKEKTAIDDLLHRISNGLKKTFDAEGFNYAWNEGPMAGQGVLHFHLHIIPRKEGDTGITKYDPRKFLYRPGSREITPENELMTVSNLIKNNL